MPPLRLYFLRIALPLCTLCFLLSSCATKNGVIARDDISPTSVEQAEAATGIRGTLFLLTPYRAEIQQGNFVSREMLSQLKEGMNKVQVRFLLGSPLLVDIFHQDRWDYVFRLKKRNGELTSSHLAIFFKDDRMERFEGKELPKESDYIARIAGSTPKK